jgi:hypothetical protein
MSVQGVALDDLLSILTGKPNHEALIRIEAALADSTSEIHAYLRSLEKFSERAIDPDAINWEALILPPEEEIPDEAVQRDEIRHARDQVWRTYSRPDNPRGLPENRTLVDAICARLDWFDDADAAQQCRVYEIAGEEVLAGRQETITTVASSGTDQETRSSAGRDAAEMAERAARLAGLEGPMANQVRALRLFEYAGRLYSEIAYLMAIPEEIAIKYVRQATVQMSMKSSSLALGDHRE